jgi:hypothetical protein
MKHAVPGAAARKVKNAAMRASFVFWQCLVRSTGLGASAVFRDGFQNL